MANRVMMGILYTNHYSKIFVNAQYIKLLCKCQILFELNFELKSSDL